MPLNEKSEQLPFIAQHLASVVKNKNEEISEEEVQKRLYKSIALTNVFYETQVKIIVM